MKANAIGYLAWGALALVLAVGVILLERRL